MFKLSCLNRYVLQTWVFPFLALLILVTFIFLLKYILFWLPNLVENDVPLALSMKFFTSLLPNILLMTIPVAYFFALYRSVKTFQSNSELDALYAGRLSLFNIFSPILWVGVVLSLLLFWMNMQLVPVSKLQMSNTLDEIGALHAMPDFTPRRFTSIDDLTFYSEGKNKDGSYAEVIISDASENKLSPNIYLAHEAVIHKTDEGLLIQLEKGNQFNGTSPRVNLTQFDTYQILVPFAFESSFRELNSESDFSFMKMQSLYQHLDTPDIKARAEWDSRWIPSISLVILFFIAIPLSLQAKRSQKGGSFLLAFFILALMEQSQLILYRKIGLGDAPWWSTWVLELIFVIVAVFLFAQVNKYGSLSRKRMLPFWLKKEKAT